MTYCLAMRLDEGLLFMSDTRTNAGRRQRQHLSQVARVPS